ncbi:CoA transferase [Nocardia sp. NPDC050799]|uniref:CaiB/BaiF CoA transferase family protein n=1 Tax=Nocardia sp. NPDC050799 TaxID=3154842 RepID=UPI0033D142A0
MHGVRVLDVGSMYAGPVVTTFLADMGADVIKVEPPGGDALRHFGYSWPIEGRGKRSVTLDIRKPEGRKLLERLAAEADIFVENYSAGTLDRLGLGPENLQAINPRLVYVRVTGYGQDGPYAERRAMDPIGLAFGGVSHLLRNSEGVPQLTGNLFIGDYATALLGALGATEALRRRDATPDGRGEVVDVSMYDILQRVTGSEVVNYTMAASKGERAEELMTVPAPWGPFRAADGIWVMVCVVPEPGMWARFVDAVDADWARDEQGRARSGLQYGEKRMVDDKVARWVGARPAGEVVETLSAQGIPAALCMTPQLLVEDEHLAATGAYEDHMTPDGVAYKMPAPIPRIGAERARVSRPAPALGEGNADVYGELLGLDRDAIDALEADGVI